MISRWAAASLISLAIALSAGGCEPSDPPASTDRLVLAREAGPPQSSQVVPRRQLLFVLDRQQRQGAVDKKLEIALRQDAPEVFWADEVRGDSHTYRPVIPPPVNPTSTRKVDLAVFGGELESVITAIAAAERGFRVALITDAPLGGLCSDTGGNLRYLDGLARIPRSPVQMNLFKALGVHGTVAMPTDVDPHIEAYLHENYDGRIALLRVSSLSNLRVEKAAKIESVLLDTGEQIVATRYLDADPECRLGELSGLPASIETPALSYGLVFDLENLRPQDRDTLRRRGAVTIDKIEKWIGVTEAQVASSPLAKASEEKLRVAIAKDHTLDLGVESLGYRAVAQGFDFAMQCREIVAPNAGLSWLNTYRVTSGFNITSLDGTDNVNSMSYQFPMTILQHAHSLAEERFAPLTTEERPQLEAYFRFLTGNPDLSIRLPNQLYVRRPTAYFATTEPYTSEDFNDHPKTKWWMDYHMDFRDLKPRDSYDNAFLAGLYEFGNTSKRWDCRPSSMSTEIPNLFLLNKCSVTPKYSGGLRIVQNLINTGQAWVDSLP